MAEIIDVIMRLQDNVTSGLARIRKNMEKTGKATQRMGRDIAKAGKNVSDLGESMLPAAAGITALGAASVKTFMSFDQTITAAGVKAGATTEELNQMREAASKMGAVFPISAQEAAAGMDRLAAGGFNASQSIAAMPGIIEASIASGEDLATTSDVVTSALSIWSLTTGDVASNTTHVADVIQAAANASKLGMQDFGLAMQYAGAPAAALGVSIEELGTAMAVMSNNGIEASSIGTGLRSMMSRLSSPPKDAAKAIEQMGLKIKDASGNFVGLENVIGQMRTAMSGMANTEQVAMAKAIAGEDAYSGLLSLIKTSPEAYKQAADVINNSSGSSHQAYMTMQKTLKGSIGPVLWLCPGTNNSVGGRRHQGAGGCSYKPFSGNQEHDCSDSRGICWPYRVYYCRWQGHYHRREHGQGIRPDWHGDEGRDHQQQGLAVCRSGCDAGLHHAAHCVRGHAGPMGHCDCCYCGSSFPHLSELGRYRPVLPAALGADQERIQCRSEHDPAGYFETENSLADSYPGISERYRRFQSLEYVI